MSKSTSHMQRSGDELLSLTTSYTTKQSSKSRVELKIDVKPGWDQIQIRNITNTPLHLCSAKSAQALWIPQLKPVIP